MCFFQASPERGAIRPYVPSQTFSRETLSHKGYKEHDQGNIPSGVLMESPVATMPFPRAGMTQSFSALRSYPAARGEPDRKQKMVREKSRRIEGPAKLAEEIATRQQLPRVGITAVFDKLQAEHSLVKDPYDYKFKKLINRFTSSFVVICALMLANQLKRGR